MSELIVAGFKGEFAAEEVLLNLFKLEQVHLVDLEDAAVAARKPDGTVRIRHSNVLVGADASVGSEVGLLIGTLLLNPLMCTLIGGLVGAAMGGATRTLEHIGVQEEFINDIAETLKPNSSALFILIRRSLPDKVIEELARFKGKIVRTSLSPKKEAELKNILLENVSLKKGPVPPSS
ncbi:membrane protein [Geotalea uraniireducens]|uniref:Membrane protein n=1 Tax=Geotalea uraniireducens TaxID=351604 RepID=A0ABN6VPL7_9BACT|nr:DUF1269 domain-containing protein [Geotalea uraniireducens]BDV42163.1 membrane protein [Geotalea uraniireducens]